MSDVVGASCGCFYNLHSGNFREVCKTHREELPSAMQYIANQQKKALESQLLTTQKALEIAKEALISYGSNRAGFGIAQLALTEINKILSEKPK